MTPEERLRAWALGVAVDDGVPPADHVAYAEALERTTLGQHVLFGIALREAAHAVAKPFLTFAHEVSERLGFPR